MWFVCMRTREEKWCRKVLPTTHIPPTHWCIRPHIPSTQLSLGELDFLISHSSAVRLCPKNLEPVRRCWPWLTLRLRAHRSEPHPHTCIHTAHFGYPNGSLDFNCFTKDKSLGLDISHLASQIVPHSGTTVCARLYSMCKLSMVCWNVHWVHVLTDI